MIFNLSEKWQEYIICRKRNSIIAISADKKRSEFFNFLIKSRNLQSFSDKDLVSMLMQAIDLACKIPYDEMEAELEWYKEADILISEPARNSPLSNPSLYTGNYV